MTPFDRIALERQLRSDGNVGALFDLVVHNARLRNGVREIYGREDWLALENARNAAWGRRPLEALDVVHAPHGAAAQLVAAAWRIGSEDSAARAACLCIVHAGRIVREWQFTDRRAFGDVPAREAASPRFGIPWEYGEVRSAPGQTRPADVATATAPRDIASHPLVVHWHRRWNLGEDADPELLARLAEPVMFCERLVCGPASAALQWRLVGRHVAAAWGPAPSRTRLELPGLSFFKLDGHRIVSRRDHYDPAVFEDQLAQRRPD